MTLAEKIKQLEDKKKSMVSGVLEDTFSYNKEDIENYIDHIKLINYALIHLKEIDVEDENSLFDVDSFVDNSKLYRGQTVHSLQTAIQTRIDTISEKYNNNKIVTNGNIASVLQDFQYYILPPKAIESITSKNITEIYLIGKNKNIDIYVDPMMTFFDNRLIFYKDENIVFELNIKDSRSVLI